MSVLQFIKTATKEKSKLRAAISGPSGSGKTMSSINLLMHMGCERVLVLDTEQGSAAKYSKDFLRPFQVLDNEFWKSNYDPRRLIQVLKEAGPHFDGIVCDSLTHFWMGTGGMLNLVNDIAKRNAQRSGGKPDTHAAWREGDKIYNELIQTILDLPCHFVACLRAKTEYVRSEDDKGKVRVQKAGMAAQIRESFEYEFDVEGLMDMDHNFVVGKTRCSALDGLIFHKPGKELASKLVEWLTDGEPAKPKASAPAPTPAVVTPEPATPAVANDAEEDNGPVTKPMPLSTSEPPQDAPSVTVFEELKTAIETAADAATLKTAGRRVTAAHRDKLLAEAEYKQLAVLYKAREKAIPKAA